MLDRPLIQRIHTEPAYRELMKTVGYLGVSYPFSKDETDRLMAKYGKEKLLKAADELFDYDSEKKVVALKEDVRKHCQAILGPAPEEWDEFYAGIVNPPPNPYRGERKEIDIVADAIAAAIEEETGMGCEVVREPQQSSLNTEKQPTELEEIRQTHGHRLRQLLLGEHDRYRRHAPSEPVHQGAVQRMDLLETEMRRRGNKVPPRPVWKEPYTPPDDDEVPARQRERNGSLCDDEPQRETQPVRSDAESLADEIAEDSPGFRPFAAHTTHRLRELLDMCEYEVAKYGPETVTYEEAARDMALIHNELQQREQDEATWFGGRS